MKSFVDFLLSKTYKSGDAVYEQRHLDLALEKCIADTQHRWPETKAETVIANIKKNQNELAVFIYRFGHEIQKDPDSDKSILDNLHWIMRECCGCEIYFNNIIGIGFYVSHSVGIVIGSRNTIGKNFEIFQNSTIGHLKDFDKGCVIGDNVTLYTSSSILGPINIGSNVIIGAHSLVLQDLPANTICYGNPAEVKTKTVNR